MAVQMLRSSVEITVFRGNQILVVTNRKWGKFSCPGGKVEEDDDPTGEGGIETLEAAARRELLEETGCEALSMRFIAGAMHKPMPHDPKRVKWFCNGFIATIGDQEPHQNEEGSKPFWTTKDDILKNSLFPGWYEWWFGLLTKLGEMP